MADIETLLTRWQAAGVLDAESAARIRAHESQVAAEPAAAGPAGLRWQGVTALILGAILLACGVVLFVSAHWDELGPGARFALVIAMAAVFHIAGGFFRPNDADHPSATPGLTRTSFGGLSSALHAVGTVATGAAIALVGQIFNIQEHWPAAVLLWALAALAGWMFLRDQAQQTLALLLVPAWVLCELGFRSQDCIGQDVYMGRLCFVWAILYITFFLGSRKKAVQGILFAVSAIAAVYGVVGMLTGWFSWSAQQGFIPFGTRVWFWVAIAAIPLIVAAFHGHKGLVPIAAAIAFSIALPWCYRTWTDSYNYPGQMHATYVRTAPNLVAHVLVAAFALFLCWWGVRLVSQLLVNLGIVGFAIAVGWFYFSDIMSKLGRSLGLIGLGILFLAGGWALEKMRRRILGGMAPPSPPAQDAIAEAAGGSNPTNANGGAL